MTNPLEPAPSLESEWHKIRRAFENAWQQGGEPAINDYLKRVEAADRSLLLRDLLQIEIQRRQTARSRADYEMEFPEHREVIADMFDAFGKAETVDYSLKPDADTQTPQGAAHAPTVVPNSPGVSRTSSPVRHLGDYELLHEVARGGMGVVFKARQKSLNRIVALKMIKAGELAGDEEVKRFHTEAEAAAKLDHPHIVPIYEVGEDGGRHYFSMGYVDGQGLDARLKDGPFPEREAAALMQKISAAVQYAHECGVVHRDLKPSNVLLDPSGEPRITDFGLAKTTETDSSLTATGQVMGTPSFMPPEQAAGCIAEIGPRSDVYSLGAMLYCLLTGRPPFQAANIVDTLRQVIEQEPVSPRQLNPSMSKDLETICLKCLEKDQTRRYDSAQSLAEDLRRSLNREPIVARPIGSLARGWRWCRRKPSQAAALGLLIVLLVVSVAGYMNETRLRATADQERDRAFRAAQRESEAHRATREAQITAETQLAQNQLNKAFSHLDEGDIDHGLHWAIQSLKTLPPDNRAMDRQIRTVIGNWQQALHSLKSIIPVDRPLTSCVNFSPDGKVVFSSFRGLDVWSIETGRKLKRRFPGAGALEATALSPDGEWLVTGGEDGVLRFYHAGTGAPEGNPRHFPKAVDLLVFSPDGRYVFAGNSLTSGMVIEVSTREPVCSDVVLRAGTDANSTVRFSPDSTTLATISENKSVQLIRIPSGQVLVDSLRPTPSADKNPGSRSWVKATAFLADGTIAIGTSDGRVQVFDASTGAPTSKVFTAGNLWGSVREIAVNPVNNDIAIAMGTLGSLDTGRVHVWSPRSNRQRAVLPHQEYVTSVDFSSNGRFILTSSADQTAVVWDARDGTQLGQALKHPGPVWKARFLENNRAVLTYCGDEAVRVWDLSLDLIGQTANWPSLTSLTATSKRLDFAFGTTLLKGGARAGLIYDLERNANAPLRTTASISAGCFTNDGKRLLTADDISANTREAVQVWSADSFQPVGPKLVHSGIVRDIAFSGDGRLMATGDSRYSKFGEANLWNVETGERLTSPISHPDAVWSVDLNYDGSKLLTGCFDGQVRLFDVKSGKLLHSSMRHEGQVWAVRFVPDSELIVSAGKDRAVRFWKESSGEPSGATLQLDGEVLAIAVSHDGTQLLTGEGGIERDEWQMRRWDIKSRAPLVFRHDLIFG